MLRIFLFLDAFLLLALPVNAQEYQPEFRVNTTLSDGSPNPFPEKVMLKETVEEVVETVPSNDTPVASTPNVDTANTPVVNYNNNDALFDNENSYNAVAETPEATPESASEEEIRAYLSAVSEEEGSELDFSDDDVLKALGEVQDQVEEENVVNVRLERPVEKADVRMGQTLEVSLLEEAPKEWSYDKNFKTLKLLGTNKVANRLIISFEVTEMGGERLYFDCIDKSNGGFKVIESRILDVAVGM